MLFLVIIINRWVIGRNYPSPLPIKKEKNQQHNVIEPSHQVGFSEQDLRLALEKNDIFIYLTHVVLSKLLTQVEMNTFLRIKGQLLYVLIS